MSKAKSRVLWGLLPLLACVPIVSGFSRTQALLNDTDTRVLLATIRETANPWAWFVGDWPLKNHFYRPISTLVFEADNALYGSAAWGYGLTNSLLCAACVLLLFWAVREALDDWPTAGLASFAFGMWHLRSVPDVTLVSWVMLGLAAASLAGIRHGKEKAFQAVAASLACVYLSTSYGPLFALAGRMIEWIPGRTASIMTLFCLAAVASYARWERLTAARRLPGPPSSTERPLRAEGPALKLEKPRWAWGWLATAFLCTALALGSYEQAVMLPGLLLAAAILMAFGGFRPRWWVHIGFWALLAGYFFLRSALVSSQVSGYQDQQFRSGPGVALDLFRYFLPPVNDFQSIQTALGTDPFVFLTGSFWGPVLGFFGFLALAWLAAKDERKWAVLGFFLMAGVAFLPMAWFKLFEHYHYWSSAYRAVFAVLAVGVGIRAAIAAVSPRGVQAPPRPHPAPGSLPHPDSSLPAS